MFNFDKRISLLETHMFAHTKREEEEMKLTNAQLEEINTTLIKLSEALILQNGKIEISSRDTLEKARENFATKDELNKSLRTVRELISSNVKLAWTIILVFSGIIGFTLNALIQLKYLHIN
jgi:hypothetical protein